MQGEEVMKSKKKSSYDIAEEASKALLGTSDSLEVWLDDKYPHAEPDVILSHIVTWIERCPECEEWVEIGELVDEDCEEQPCGSCRD